MSKPLNEFGGWLFWFSIGMWLSLVISVVFTLLTLTAAFAANTGLEVINSLIYSVDLGIGAFLCFKIVKLIKIQDPATPDNIVKFMSWILLVTLLFFIPELWLGNILYDGKVLAEIVKVSQKR